MPGSLSTKDNDLHQLMELIDGYRATCLIGAACQIGLIEALGNLVVSITELSTRLHLDAIRLQRFARALAVLGIVRWRSEQLELTDKGRLLLPQESQLGGKAMLAVTEYLPAWANVHYSLRTGEPAFDNVFGVTAWQHRQSHPALADSFNRIMVENQRQSCEAVVNAYDFVDCRTIVDVGGGYGALLSEIVQRYSEIHGTLFDQPAVIEAAQSTMAAAGILERCELIGGSFFKSVPTGRDAYVLQHILHDWNDEQCRTILHNCRSAMREDSRLLIVENMLPENDAANQHVIMLDLHMMVVLGGQERTVREYTALLATEGLAVKYVQNLGKILIIEAKPN